MIETFYQQAAGVLTEAHKACLIANQGPTGDALGMSSGAFSGVNKALGIIFCLEEELNKCKNEKIRLQIKLRDLENNNKKEADNGTPPTPTVLSGG